MRIEETPHKLHLFFCTNVRENGEKSCGDTEDTAVLADKLKKRFKESKLPVRITRTACLGPCAQGPNIMCYPQEVWFQDVSVKDADAIEESIRKLLASPLSPSEQPQPTP
jgi:(2Fe-2S) ferredoxin